MSSAIIICLADPRDVDSVLVLVEALLEELGDEGREFARTDRARLRSDLEHAIDSVRFWALLARDESGTPVGVLTLSSSFAIYAGGEYGVIDEMYVKPEHRGRGVGRRLVDSAVGIAVERDWFRLEVTGPVAATDAPVLGFYRHLGFERTGQKLRLLVPVAAQPKERV